ncbi:uncharacterized protein LOC18447548 isoform X2 [Amborella trichopoda]|uniref:uncharacterized protein LOC18447548 isoform X2 n=1 Tax=Amborella trichopoda TaxID=13333 RepID=UPI0009BEC8E7|nr:uncharacterized protein LOC18447548 isoform X2 [Amborella trichopoda]|eukprot:XP_020531247.1 uncharacterized protein LOC18447548 isoform X2 [Amborella trichopoda]
MDSSERGFKESEDQGNTEPDETSPRRKKRVRRVSFADTTCIRFFDRDEDFETPPDSKPADEELGNSEAIGENQKGEGLDEELEEGETNRVFFVRPDESPGSETGSATSNGEYNFFGPVDSSFIQSGRFSESPEADDITMDSTTFSLRFGKLMQLGKQSGSSGEFDRTPSMDGPSLLIKNTPTEDAAHTGSGYLMSLTGSKKQFCSDEKSNGSDEMSLINEDPHRYDYERLSPRSTAVLEDSFKKVHLITACDHTAVSKSFQVLSSSKKFLISSEKSAGSSMETLDLSNRDIEAMPVDDNHHINISKLQKLDGLSRFLAAKQVGLSPHTPVSEVHDLSTVVMGANLPKESCEGTSGSGQSIDRLPIVHIGKTLSSPTANMIDSSEHVNHKTDFDSTVASSKSVESPGKGRQQPSESFSGSASTDVVHGLQLNSNDATTEGVTDHNARVPLTNCANRNDGMLDMGLNRSFINNDKKQNTGQPSTEVVVNHNSLITPFAVSHDIFAKEFADSKETPLAKLGPSKDAKASAFMSESEILIQESSKGVKDVELLADDIREAILIDRLNSPLTPIIQRPTLVSDHFPEQDSAFSLRSKRWKLLSETMKPSGGLSSTPFTGGMPFSSLIGEEVDVGHNQMMTPLIGHRTSTFGSSKPKDLSERIGRQHSKISLSKSDQMGDSLGVMLSQNKTGAQLQQEHAPISRLAVHSLSFLQNGATSDVTHVMHGSVVYSPKIMTENSGSLVCPEEHGKQTFEKQARDCPNQEAHASFHSSIHHLPTSHLSMGGVIGTPHSYSSQLHTASLEKNINAGKGSKFFSSPTVKLDLQLPSVSKSKEPPLRDSNQHNILGKPSYSPSVENPMKDHVANTIYALKDMTLGAEDRIFPELLQSNNRQQGLIPVSVLDSNNVSKHSSMKDVLKETSLCVVQKEFEGVLDYQTPLQERTSSFFPSNQGKDVQMETIAKTYQGDNTTTMEISMSATPEQSGKNLVGRVAPHMVGSNVYSPLYKDPISFEQNRGLRSIDKSASIRNSQIQDGEISALAVNLSGKKRKSDSLLVTEESRMNKTDMGPSKASSEIKASPTKGSNLEHKTSSTHLEEGHVEIEGEDISVGGLTMKNVTDEKISGPYEESQYRSWVISKLAISTKELFSTSIVRLKPRELCILQEMLDQLKKIMEYRHLCNEIQSQKMLGRVCNVQPQRLLEEKTTRQLLQSILYEQAKLQLMHMKRDYLLAKVQQLQSGMQECGKLKSSCLSHQHASGLKDSQSNKLQICPVSDEYSSDQAVMMRRELGLLDQKVKKLVESLHSSCKLKGHPNADETIMLSKDFVHKKACCTIICHTLQLWDLKVVKEKHGDLHVALNYGNFLCQRYKLDAHIPASSVDVSNLLNEENIGKIFPNINACTAFKFVFSDDRSRKLSSTRGIQVESQVTSFLLGNLLDVLSELQMAHLELLNVMLPCFQPRQTGRLELRLSFIGCSVGRKVILVLDLTDLNRALYPSDILPAKLQVLDPRTQTTDTSLSNKIIQGLQSLEAGNLRIRRMCETVSQYLKSPES